FDALTVASSKSADSLLKKFSNSLVLDKALGKNYNEISEEQFRLISSPLAHIIQESVKMRSFKNDPGWIKERLTLLEVTENEIQENISALLELGLLVEDDGHLKPAQVHYKTPFDVSSEALKN